MRREYDYSLDRTSRKHVCPKCGRKTFVLYLDGNGLALDPTVGKCDRKDNCDWHYPPRDFFRDHASLCTLIGRNESHRGRLGSRYGRPGWQRREEYQEPSYMEPRLMTASQKEYGRNPLMRYLHGLFDRILDAGRIDGIARMMGVGTSRQFGGSVVFWQVDPFGHIRSGKIMGYDAETGKRIKKPYPQVKWVHSLLRDTHPGYRFGQCYFGAHTIAGADRHCRELREEMESIGEVSNCVPTIWLFESEKAALIVKLALAWCNALDVFYPMACGGCEGFNPTEEKLRNPYSAVRLLKGRQVVLFPDEGKYEEWKQKAEGLKGYCEKVWISATMEAMGESGSGDGFDDIIIRYVEKGEEERLVELITYSY